MRLPWSGHSLLHTLSDPSSSPDSGRREEVGGPAPLVLRATLPAVVLGGARGPQRALWNCAAAGTGAVEEYCCRSTWLAGTGRSHRAVDAVSGTKSSPDCR